MPAVRTGRSASGRDTQPKPRSDAYTGLLLLSLLAQVAGAVFLYIDWSRYPATVPPKPTALAASPSVGAPAAQPAAPAPAAPAPAAPAPAAPAPAAPAPAAPAPAAPAAGLGQLGGGAPK